MIFSIAMGADYSFYVKTIDNHARAFLALHIFAIGRVEARFFWDTTLPFKNFKELDTTPLL